MERLYRSVFNLITRATSYGTAVTAFSIVWSGLFTIINLMYLIPILSRYYDFSPEWFFILKILFALPFPTSLFLYGAFTRLGIPAVFPSFRRINRHINAEGGGLGIRGGLPGDEYLAILKSLNRVPGIFFFVAVFEVAYIDLVVLIIAIYKQYSFTTIAWIFFSWIMQTVNYGGVGFVLAEAVTGRMRQECKKKLRALNIPHELPTRASIVYKMVIIALMVLFTISIATAMTYHQRTDFIKVVTYIAIYSLLIAFISFLTQRVVTSALGDVMMVIENLKEKGEGIIYSTSLDREMVKLEAGINSASDIITDYRQNLELKVEQRTRELSRAKDEIEAAMEELESVNENLVHVNRQLEDSNIRYQKDMAMAASLQSAFLPGKPPRTREFDIGLVFRPMSGVSGDFYDFYQHDGILHGTGIFDVSGHGISSGLVTVLARSIIEKIFKSHEEEKLGDIMAAINDTLIGEIGQTGYYITGILLRLGHASVEYVNSGHPHMLFKAARSKSAGRVAEQDGSSIIGPFLGLEMIDKTYRTLDVTFLPGDSLLLYTDSLIETKSPDGEPFDEERVMKALGDAPDGPAQEMLDYIMEQFYKFTQKADSPTDDVTAILIKKK